MPINVPMYQARLPQFRAGPFIHTDQSDAVEKALARQDRLKQQRFENRRRSEQDILAEEIARAELGQGQRALDLRQAGQERDLDTTELYQRGQMKMQMVMDLWGQQKPNGEPYTAQEIVELVNQDYDRVKQQLQSARTHSGPNRATTEPPYGIDSARWNRARQGQPSATATAPGAALTEPPQYEPEPADLPYPTRTPATPRQGQTSQRYSVGQEVTVQGKKYRVVGFDTDGEPLVDEVK